MSFSDEASILWPKTIPLLFLLHVTVNFSVLASQTQRQLLPFKNGLFQKVWSQQSEICLAFWTHQANPKELYPELHTLLPNPTKKGASEFWGAQPLQQNKWLIKKKLLESPTIFRLLSSWPRSEKNGWQFPLRFPFTALNETLSVLGRFWRLLVASGFQQTFQDQEREHPASVGHARVARELH